jgi:hypothetical protein
MYYLITLIVRDQIKGKKTMQGVVEDPERDINRAFQKFHFKYASKFSETHLLYFNCYQLARQSIEVMQFLNKQIKVDFSVDLPELGEADPNRPKNKSRRESMDRKFTSGPNDVQK